MQLPLISLVPTVVEIIAFIENNWPHVWWFPNWYLGVPLRFMTGPVVPMLVILLQKLTGLSVTTVYLGAIGAAWGSGGIGVRFLLKSLGGEKNARNWASLLFVLLPFHFLLITYGNGLHHIIIALLPWVFYLWLSALKFEKNVLDFLTTGFITIILLIDISGLLPLVIGGMALCLIGKFADWVKRIVKSVLYLLTAFSFATIWYSPRFWWILLGNPSFGGKPLANAIPFAIQLLAAFFPLALGVWVVQKRFRSVNKLTQFGWFFGASFLFLTCIRFLSDVDFWIDWTGYLLEIQLALSLLAGSLISHQRSDLKSKIMVIGVLAIANSVIGYSSIKYNGTQKLFKADIVQLVKLNRKPEERIFLSGSPVFWLGSEIQNTLQVRGGRDEAATHPYWAVGAYNIRVGDSLVQLENWAKALGISHVLVETGASRDYFHDYKQLNRFDIFNQVVESNGDRLYKFDGAGGRLADKDILIVKKPRDGADTAGLSEYVKKLGAPVSLKFINPQQIEITTRQLTDMPVSLAMTYDASWKIINGQGRIDSDALGNMFIELDGQQQKLIIRYTPNWMDIVPGIITTAIGVLLLMRLPELTELISRRLNSLGFNKADEDKEY